MHPDLSSHLHTDKCNAMISSWRQCRADHVVLQFTGYCNTHYSAMLQCLKEERIARRAENFRKSQEWQRKVKERAQAEIKQ